MIFIVLGTQKFQLNRLLQEMDDYAAYGKIKEKIIAQIGNSTYEPENFEYIRFMDKKNFDETVEKADIIVTHSGVGTIITALRANKPVVVYPRLKKYKEHVDDHQLDIAKAFEKKNYVLCCYEEDNLLSKIKEANEIKFEKYISEREKLVNIIDSYISNI
ncbi:MAG: glycosyl transferase [Lachnospiraceae bacterium]|nr:glycosyl transferase [Lachnospiraceae bacterium]